MSWLTALLQRPTLSIEWWDLVDIAIVSFLIYELLLLIRGTRALQMAVGGGFLIALFFVSRWLHFETVNWLIRNLAGYVVFAVIVLFQSDIARTLEGEEDIVEELVVTCTTLAARRIGAIIVIEREIGLRNYIEGGIPLDATVTYDLLATIFQPGSPLHDGAVIVQGERIAAAACFLPLSVNPRLSKDLGTRHRAALGLTEENDALAIVVSEETGSIALVTGGDLERGVTAERLRASLREGLGPRRGRAERRLVRDAMA